MKNGNNHNFRVDTMSALDFYIHKSKYELSQC